MMARFKRAQAATEVAIFGAVVIFLIGMIIRTTISNQYSQNQNFKAMRLAMAKSLESAKEGKTERNNASVLYIEDRLVPDFNKYGSLERTPFIASGSGTMSHIMTYPVDESDVNDSIPKMDVYINGQYFPFTTAALHAKIIVPPSERPIVYTGSPRADVPSPAHFNGWDYRCQCSTRTSGTPAVTTETCYACPIFYQTVPRGSRTPAFCVTDSACGYLTANEAFDLNRNGDFSDDPKPDTDPRADNEVSREYIGWQWRADPGTVARISSQIDTRTPIYPTYDIDGDRKEETLYGINRINWLDTNASLNAIVDVEVKADAQEQINALDAATIAKLATLQAQGIVTDVMVVDYQDGDIDFTYDNTVQGSQRGLQPEMAIYTKMRQEKGVNKDSGTYFLVKEGKLYNPEAGTTVRSVNKRDQVDLVERHFLLSKNTWRFCNRDGSPIPPLCIARLGSSITTCEVAPNPVEVCASGTGTSERSGCFSQDNVAKTCLDTSNNMLYVRTRVVNRGGHKWITDVTDKRADVNLR